MTLPSFNVEHSLQKTSNTYGYQIIQNKNNNNVLPSSIVATSDVSSSQNNEKSLSLVNLPQLMKLSKGDSSISIGLIDGPVDFSHPAFKNSKIRTAKRDQMGACKNANSIACMHGTFVSGILCADDKNAPSISPNCELVLRPVFNEYQDANRVPNCSPEELADAIIETVDEGVRLINLSVELTHPHQANNEKLNEACNYAYNHNVMLIGAAGNSGTIGTPSLPGNPGIIYVAACNDVGRPLSLSNFGSSLSARGLMAPGQNIISASPGNKYSSMSGTSFAAPIVTGAIALLWSIHPSASYTEIKNAILRIPRKMKRSIIPPLLDAKSSLEILEN